MIELTKSSASDGGHGIVFTNVGLGSGHVPLWKLPWQWAQLLRYRCFGYKVDDDLIENAEIEVGNMLLVSLSERGWPFGRGWRVWPPWRRPETTITDSEGACWYEIATNWSWREWRWDSAWGRAAVGKASKPAPR